MSLLPGSVPAIVIPPSTGDAGPTPARRLLNGCSNYQQPRRGARMDLRLGPKHSALRDKARRFTEEHLIPYELLGGEADDEATDLGRLCRSTGAPWHPQGFIAAAPLSDVPPGWVLKGTESETARSRWPTGAKRSTRWRRPVPTPEDRSEIRA
jgi:hypothetical protein